NKGLSRPEISTLLAYTKTVLDMEIRQSELPDEPYMCGLLERYFPKQIRKKYNAEIRQHQLRREIISTVITNNMVNRAGITFAHRLSDETGASIEKITMAYLV
ncbi:MAG: hypothetical protein GTO60_10815, partial [Gammaproteobacteria bacterium]|nr:hypothetical protein [Gammaproteobacteria bacterium]NIO62380.1 hypothetical protein [Gammaproteobacteria bacterium]